MKFLCLAYGAEEDWNTLSGKEQEELLAQDERLRQRGTLMGSVRTQVVTVTAWDGNLRIAEGRYAPSDAPLAGFSVIEAANVDEVARLVARTPCARARGAIEIRPILVLNDAALRAA